MPKTHQRRNLAERVCPAQFPIWQIKLSELRAGSRVILAPPSRAIFSDITRRSTESKNHLSGHTHTHVHVTGKRGSKHWETDEEKDSRAWVTPCRGRLKLDSGVERPRKPHARAHVCTVIHTPGAPRFFGAETGFVLHQLASASASRRAQLASGELVELVLARGFLARVHVRRASVLAVAEKLIFFLLLVPQFFTDRGLLPLGNFLSTSKTNFLSFVGIPFVMPIDTTV